MSIVKDWSDKLHIKRYFYWITAIVALGLVLWLLFAIFANYSSGSRAGTVMKISKKGYVFKTYEGQLYMGGIGVVDNQGQGLGGNIWAFSAIDPKVVSDLETAAAQGHRVSLHYEEKYYQLWWRGDTRYFVTQVEEVK